MNLPNIARADDPDLHPGFGASGKVTTDFLSGLDGASAVALQPDGKIVAAGGALDENDWEGFDLPNKLLRFALARYNTDGSLDKSFGSGGKVTTRFPSGGFVKTIALRDGKIIATGVSVNTDNAEEDFTLVRFNANGSLDLKFGSQGKVTTDFYGGLSRGAQESKFSSDSPTGYSLQNAHFVTSRRSAPQ